MDINLYEDRDEDSRQVQQLHALIGRLGVIDRAIVLLWLENLSYEEIAGILGISVKNVSVKLVRIKEKLIKMNKSGSSTMEENKTIEELRNQIALLKQKLDNQEIVSDRMLRMTMQTKVNTVIHRNERRHLICSIFAMLTWPILHYGIGMDLAFCIFTSLMMLFCIIATVYIHRPMHLTDLMSADLATVAYEMDRLKRRYKNWLHYVTPTLIIPWFLGACYEYDKAMGIDPLSKDGIITCLPLLIGTVIGGVIGFIWHSKTVDTAESIIRQIED